MLISSAFAQSATDVASSGGSLTGMIIQLLLIFVIFYLLLIRPQQKRLKEHEARLKAIKRGDKIVTGGGIFAKVLSVNEAEDALEAEIAEKTVVKIARSTVREVLTDETVAPSQNKKK